MKKVLIYLSLILLAVVNLSAPAQAEDASNSSVLKKYNITFPISELGNCNSLSECHQFCENALNQNTCVEFAKKKAFYKAESTQKKKTDFLEKAKKELGCDSEEACKAFCGLQENWLRCGEFAKKNLKQLPSETQNTNQLKQPQGISSQLLLKAKELLGCDSNDSCKLFCQQEQNKKSCQEFAKAVGLGEPNKNSQPANLVNPALDRESCRSLKEKLEKGLASPETIKAYYEKYCLLSPKPVVSATKPEPIINKEEYCKKYPDRCNFFSPKPSETTVIKLKSPKPTTPSAVQGVSTEQNLLVRILNWLGF